MSEELFDASDYQILPDPDPNMGSAAKQTRAQLVMLTNGTHPATRLPLLPTAAAPEDKTGPGIRCGTCTHLIRKFQGNGTWLKCELARTMRSDGPDAKAWWPACLNHTPADPKN